MENEVDRYSISFILYSFEKGTVKEETRGAIKEEIYLKDYEDLIKKIFPDYEIKVENKKNKIPSFFLRNSNESFCLELKIGEEGIGYNQLQEILNNGGKVKILFLLQQKEKKYPNSVLKVLYMFYYDLDNQGYGMVKLKQTIGINMNEITIKKALQYLIMKDYIKIKERNVGMNSREIIYKITEKGVSFFEQSGFKIEDNI